MLRLQRLHAAISPDFPCRGMEKSQNVLPSAGDNGGFLSIGTRGAAKLPATNNKKEVYKTSDKSYEAQNTSSPQLIPRGRYPATTLHRYTTRP
jgi:hypothetical protein